MTTFAGLILAFVMFNRALVPYDLKPSPIGPDTGSTHMAAMPVIYLGSAHPDTTQAAPDSTRVAPPEDAE